MELNHFLMFCKHTHYQYAIQDLVWPDGIEPPTWDYESHELPLLHGHTLACRIGFEPMSRDYLPLVFKTNAFSLSATDTLPGVLDRIRTYEYITFSFEN